MALRDSAADDCCQQQSSSGCHFLVGPIFTDQILTLNRVYFLKRTRLVMNYKRVMKIIITYAKAEDIDTPWYSRNSLMHIFRVVWKH